MVHLQENGGIAIIVAAAVLLGTVAYFALRKVKRKGPIALDPDNYKAFKLIEREEISHDTRRFRFALPTPQHILGLPTGKHISMKYTEPDGKLVTRSYTPVSSDDEPGYVEFVIKVYFKNIHPKFPDGGKMSQHLDRLSLGDSIDLRGPKGSLHYTGRGRFEIKKQGQVEVRKAKQVGLIAGGTGITPMLQIVREVFKDRQDRTQLYLLFANQTEDDILLRKELEGLAQEQPERLRVHFTLDRPPAKWTGSTGFITADMCRSHLPPPGRHTQILVCGPPPMVKFACLPAFEQLGLKESNYYCY